MSDCPSEHDLKNYALGKMVKDRIDDIERHIDTCNLCQSTLETTSFEKDDLIRAMRFGRDENTLLEDSSWKGCGPLLTVEEGVLGRVSTDSEPRVQNVGG